MTPNLLLLTYCLLIVLASLIGGWVPVLLRMTHKQLELVVSLVAGFMLGVGLLHLLPEAVHVTGDIEHVVIWALYGFLVMFFIERFFCFHHHDMPGDDGQAHDHRDAHSGHAAHHGHDLSWTGAAIGLTLHSVIAGVGLAASVQAESVSGSVTWLGLPMFLVIVLHKPFDALTLGTLMTVGGWSVAARHLINAVFALAVPAGVLLVMFGIGGEWSHGHVWVGTALAFVSGTVLCIAMSDLLPELQFHQHDRGKLSAALLSGLILAWLVGLFHAKGHEPGHAHEVDPAHESVHEIHHEEEHDDEDFHDHASHVEADRKSEVELDIGTMVYVGDEFIRGYRPRPALLTRTSIIDKAKFPVIDVHCHWMVDLDPETMIEAMDERGIRLAVNLSGDSGPKLDRMLKRFCGVAPDRFVIFCTPDFGLVDEPDFGPAVERFIEQAHADGVSGVKIYKSLGLTIKDGSDQIVPVDDPRLDPVWATAGRLKMPVLIHTADPVAFFEPVDGANERWMQLKRHPDWGFHGSEFPERTALLEQRNCVIERHPQTTFIGAHVGNSAEDLATLSGWLDRYPNFVVDISGRVAELGRQPYSARAFFLKYQDRILFGTDRYPGRPDQPRYRIYYRFLETDDEYFDYHDHHFPPAGEWRIYGIKLPDDVLKKVYFDNAARVLGLAE